MSRPTLLNLRELELAQQAYEVAWAKIVRREPKRNTTKDDERKELLRSRLFAMVCRDQDDAEALCDRVLATMPQYWPGRRRAGRAGGTKSASAPTK
jgi:hypothetical protein